jgi:hypothetical protein
MLVQAQKHRQALHRVGVVIDHQQAQGHGVLHPAVRDSFGLQRRHFRDHGQAHDELAPPADAGAVGLDLAPVHLDKAFRHGQADAQPALRTVYRPIPLHEGQEDAGQHFRQDADARVPDPDDDLRPFTLPRW